MAESPSRRPSEATGFRGPGEVPGQASEPEILKTQRRNWQLWSLLILGLIVVGIVCAVYQARLALSQSSRDLSALVGPLLFGVISLVVLAQFYVTQKQAIIQGLEHELIQQKIEAELNRELSLLDPVTEVYNRRYLRALLGKEVGRAQRYNEQLTVMMVDITGFRRVNESLGYTGGDVVLRQIAHLIQTRVRNSDTVVRFGGDEFLVILPDTDEEGRQRLAVRLKESLEEWSHHSGMVDFGLRLAIGVEGYTPGRPVEEMLKRAEQRMLEDKGSQPESARGARPAAATGKTTV
jgi:diguanylate cyclase (GGDEF)-like protein